MTWLDEADARAKKAAWRGSTNAAKAAWDYQKKFNQECIDTPGSYIFTPEQRKAATEKNPALRILLEEEFVSVIPDSAWTGGDDDDSWLVRTSQDNIIRIGKYTLQMPETK